MNIRELLIRIGITGANAADREVRVIDQRIDSLKNSVNNLGAALGAAFGLLSIGAIVHAADEMQTLEFRVGQVAQSQGTAAEAFDKVAAHANASRISVEAYVEAYAGIGAATHDLVHDQEDLMNVTDTVSKGLQLAGANTQQTTSVMSQLTQAISIQKLQWEDLKVIMQNSDAFAVRLAKSLGMSLSEMIKATQGQGGGIGADKIIAALRDMKAEVDETFKTMPMTVSQAMVVVTNRFDLLVHGFNRASGAITYVANLMLTAFDSVESGSARFAEALGGAENAVKLLGVALGAAGLVGGIALLNGALGLLFSPIGLLIGALATAYLVGQDFYTWLQGGPSLIGDMIGPVDEYREGLDTATDSMKDLRDMAIGLLHALNGLADFFNSGQDIAEQLGDWSGLSKVGPALKEGLSWLGQDLGKWAGWANEQTNGAFDIPQMWGDAVRGTRESNQRYQPGGDLYDPDSPALNHDRYKPNVSLNPAVEQPQIAPYSARPAGDVVTSNVTGATTSNLNVTIQSISIDRAEGDTTESQVRGAVGKGVGDAMMSAKGFGTTLGNSLNFAGGGS